MKLYAAPVLAFAVLALAGPVDAKKEAQAETPHLSCTGEPNELLIVVKNVKESVGLISAELYRNEEATFLTKEGRERRIRVAARAPVTKFCIHAPATAAYAMAIYHDENANLKFDKGPFGLPAEPYGVSNNPRMRFAPPTIGEALFHVDINGAKVEIDLKD
ncbi:MAG: DUF2141 domain-containing protein [Parvularculaceae bacterium]